MAAAHDPPTADGAAAHAAGLARAYLDSLGERPVGPPASVEALRRALGDALPDCGEDPIGVGFDPDAPPVAFEAGNYIRD